MTAYSKSGSGEMLVPGKRSRYRTLEVLVRDLCGWIHPTGLLEIHFAEPEALKHSRDRTARVFGSDLEDAILQRGLLELTLSFFAHFAFEVGVRRRKKAGVT